MFNILVVLFKDTLFCVNGPGCLVNPLSATYNLKQMAISNLAAFSKNNKYGMIFHENRLLAKFVSSAAVVIGALRVN